MKKPIARLSLLAALALLLALCLLATAGRAPAGAARITPSAGSAFQVSVAPLDSDYLRSLVVAPVEALSSAAGRHGLGARPGPQDFSYTRGMKVPGARERGTLPVTYDLRTLGKVTPVKDQNPHGTCWAFASLGSLESCLLPGETWDFSEDNMLLTNGFDNRGDPYTSGNIVESTAYLVRWSGPVNESEDAYDDNYTPPSLTPCKHVQEVNWIPLRGSPTDNDNVKNAVMQYGGVDAAMAWYGAPEGSSYYNAATASYYYYGSASINHEVLIVGWDDDYPATNFATAPPGNGAFIVKNSWGARHGSSGYLYVSYYDSKLGRSSNPMAVFDKAESTGNYTGIYQYDPLGYVGGLGFWSSTGWFANLFTAQAAASLSAVGFYTVVPGASYEVYTGASLATKTLRTSGTLAYMGYHTVTLPSPVGITNGQQFVVAIKMTSPGDSHPIAVEYPVAGHSSAAAAQAGQSYVSSTGSSWTDLTTQYTNANVCLKAYVQPVSPPAITGFVPTSGPVGTNVTVTGSGFAWATAVTFNGTPASFTADSDRQITATVPDGATSGRIVVTTTGGTTTSATSFTVVPAPAITRLTPTSGKRGVLVTISGTDFGAARGASAVKFGATKCTRYVSWDDTHIRCRVPAKTRHGAVKVTVTTTAGRSNFLGFTVER
jgi:C1A family cysteine protease